jgi:predicted membrane chloride channel (bestrophin family)
MNGWFGMRKFLTTPVPFPLIQMTRTIVLIYVYSLPLVFLKDDAVSLMWEHCVVVFLLSYGFLGLELVSIELDDPFGNDDNDFDCLAYARIVFEDAFLMINDTDGPEYADIIRRRMHSGKRPYRGSSGGATEASETTELLYNDEFSV